MKKTIFKVLALVLVVVMICGILVACGNKPSGKYSADLVLWNRTYEFKGNKVSVTSTGKISGKSTTVEGTYEIVENEDDSLQIKFAWDSEDRENEIFNGAWAYEIGDDYIKIAGVKYTKAK